MTTAAPMTDAERRILERLDHFGAALDRVEATLTLMAERLTPPADTRPVEWRCGCWTDEGKVMPSAPPGVLCKGCGSKARWRP